MASAAAEEAVRTYLTALKDPASLRDDDTITKLERELDSAEDPVQRLALRQQLIDAKRPSVEAYEGAFTKHAKAWAEEHGVTADAFASEGVPAAVLRRAGFAVRGARGRGRASGRTRSGGRTRVTTEEVRKAIPRGTFTIRKLEERTGASTAVVRKVVQAELEAGRVSAVGPDPDHAGPGRAPTLYRR
jgi:hypothetical protein